MAAGFQDRCNRPLCHLSGCHETTQRFALESCNNMALGCASRLNSTVSLLLSMTESLVKIEALVFGGAADHFEGDTLVVESAGFNEKTFIDATGTPHGDQLRTVERIRKVNPNQLEIVITVHDPEYYSRDWQARFVYTQRNDIRIEDYLCGEPHRDISSVRGVRRP